MKHTSLLLLYSYTSLLSQYMAVSYGDALFSCFLLLPLQQRFAPQLRKVEWGDHPSIPRLLTLPVTQVGVCSLAAINSLRRHLLCHSFSPSSPSTSFYSIYHIFAGTNFQDSLTLTEKIFIQVKIVQSVWVCCKLYTVVCYLLSLRFR